MSGVGTDRRAPLDRVRTAVEAVPDPEVPVLTVGDLGVLRGVQVHDDDPGRLVVTVTPTYSGCPAMDVIRRDVARAARSLGWGVEVRTVLSPAWTTDWMSEQGRRKLREFGIAPPTGSRSVGGARAAGPVPVTLGATMLGATTPRTTTAPSSCPQCGSAEVEELSRFGSTACKSLWRCRSCAEPFDYFKPL